jgi:hypothetical protein
VKIPQVVRSTIERHWLAWVVLAAATVAFVVYFHELYHRYIKAYPALITPLLLSVVSFFLHAGEAGGRTTPQSFANDITVGVVSFDVWAITSASTSSSRVANISPTKVLDLTDVILCLVSGFVLLVFCYYTSTKAKENPETRLRYCALVAAVLVFLSPAGMASTAQSPSAGQTPVEYRVIVPYVDESVVRQMGAAKLGGRFFCAEYPINAGSARAAREEAVKQFKGSALATPLYGRRGGKVSVREDFVAARQVD